MAVRAFGPSLFPLEIILIRVKFPSFFSSENNFWDSTVALTNKLTNETEKEREFSADRDLLTSVATSIYKLRAELS